MEEKMPVIEKEYSKGRFAASIVLTIISTATLIFTSFFFAMIMDGFREGGVGMVFIGIIGFPIFLIADGVTFLLAGVAEGLSISNVVNKANAKTITMLILPAIVIVITVIFFILVFAH